MLVFVSLMAKLGGIFVQAIQGGQIFGLKLPNLLGKIKIPTLVGMIFMGILAWNLNEYTYNAFNIKWSRFCSVYILLFIWLWAGMEVEINKLGVMAFALAYIPLIMSMFGISLIGYFMFRFPWLISLEFGTFLNGLSPSV